MSRRDDLAVFRSLVHLQELARLFHRGAYSQACGLTGECISEHREAERECKVANRRLDEILSSEVLCVDRLTLVAKDLAHRERRDESARTALDDARCREEAARADYLEACERLKWTERKVQDIRNKQLSKREEEALQEVTGLRTFKAPRP